MNQYEKKFFDVGTLIGLIPGLLLLYAPLHQGDYGFFVALRIIVCIASLYRIVQISDESQRFKWTTLLFLFSLILFQPFWSWGIERELWSLFDVLYGLVFLGYSIMRVFQSAKQSQPVQKPVVTPEAKFFVADVKKELSDLTDIFSGNPVFTHINPHIQYYVQNNKIELSDRSNTQFIPPVKWLYMYLREYCISRFKSGECHWIGGEISPYGESVFELFDHVEDKLAIVAHELFTAADIKYDKEWYRKQVRADAWENQR